MFRLCCRFCKSAPLKKQEKLDLSMHKIIAILQNSAAFAPRQAIYELEGQLKKLGGFKVTLFCKSNEMKCLSKSISSKYLHFYILIKIPKLSVDKKKLLRNLEIPHLPYLISCM